MIRLAGYLLAGIHTYLAIWSLGGFAEWIFHDVPWKPFSNPDFPRWVLFFHWTSIGFASTVFLYGYFTRWWRTPKYVTIGYGMMAAVCVVETFWFMTSESKYLAMGLEFTAYILILILLYHARFYNAHFSSRTPPGGRYNIRK